MREREMREREREGEGEGGREGERKMIEIPKREGES